MTAAEANAVLAMTVDQLVTKELVGAALVPNLTSQRDDAITSRDAYDAEKAELVAAHETALKNATEQSAAEHAGVVSALQGQVDELTTTLAASQALVEALGGTEAGQRMKREAERERLTAAIREAEAAKVEAAAKLAELGE